MDVAPTISGSPYDAWSSTISTNEIKRPFDKNRVQAHEGKSSGSESGGLSEGISTRLRGVAGEELGKAIGDELPAGVESALNSGSNCQQIVTHQQTKVFSGVYSYQLPSVQ